MKQKLKGDEDFNDVIDSQSTVNPFCNPNLLTNIRQINDQLTVLCNAGVVKNNMVGDLGGYDTVWYYPDGIANILSLYLVATTMHVQYDSMNDQ